MGERDERQEGAGGRLIIEGAGWAVGWRMKAARLEVLTEGEAERIAEIGGEDGDLAGGDAITDDKLLNGIGDPIEHLREVAVKGVAEGQLFIGRDGLRP